MPRLLIPFALSLLTLLHGPAHADAVLRFVDSQGEQSQLLVKGPYARMDIVNAGSGSTGFMLFHSEQRSLYMIDDGNGTYMRFDEAVVDSQIRAMEEMIAQMRAQIQQLPSEARADMERQLGLGVDTGPVRVETRPTGTRRELGGLRCEEKEILVGGRVQSVACVATAEELGLSRVDFETMNALVERLFELSRRALDSGGPIAQALGTNVMPRLDGVPVKVRDVGDGVTTQLVGISTDTISPEFFRVPTSYREQAPF